MIAMACSHLPLATQCKTEHKASLVLTFNVLFFSAHQEGDSTKNPVICLSNYGKVSLNSYFAVVFQQIHATCNKPDFST